jgi:hypothetical protein
MDDAYDFTKAGTTNEIHSGKQTKCEAAANLELVAGDRAQCLYDGLQLADLCEVRQ